MDLITIEMLPCEGMSQHRIAVIPGDGIGTEVIPEGLRVLDAAAAKFGIDLHYDHFDFSSCDYYLKHGKMMPDNWKELIGGHDAIFFGAVGWPAKSPRSHLFMGLAAAVPPRVRSVRQFAPRAPDARHPQPSRESQARRDRLLRGARKHRR